MISNTSTRQKYREVSLIAGLLFTLPFSNTALSAAVVKLAPKPVIKMPLNDTGIATCSNGIKNGLRCPQKNYPGQDAEYGRDKTANNNSNGHAGFNFTKIGSKSNVLPTNAKVWNCVKDNVTGLMWEGKTNDGGLHDMDWTYSWYNPNNRTNGRSAGTKNGGKCVNTTSCDTNAYVKAVNKVGWCGHKDWRMPTRMELTGLTALDRIKPESGYFSESNIALVWSSSPGANFIHFAWIVDFNDGTEGTAFKDGAAQVRLVRGG